MASSLLSPGSLTKAGDLASLHISHNHSLPVILSTIATTAEEEGYAEGVVTNTKFGSFPHSTLLNVPWGSQVRASKVDTGSRGRTPGYGHRKRKADAISDDATANETGSPGSMLKEATTASSGFLHILPSTPENWTTSLPHRTQVVYTPDYSYILHRLRARPGSKLIEAGSGSGSFTHAAVRAVFNGYPASSEGSKADETRSRKGKVFTFEFHPERHEKVKVEMQKHGLDNLVTATHRDVYKDGFLLKHEDGSSESPLADSVFLDLPAPWEALQHLTRETSEGNPSALNSHNQVHICTFSPCIEQVQRTVSAMRKYGWIDIEMVEMQHKRVEVRRDFTGLKYDGMRSVNPYAADVEEAISKLKEIEDRARLYHATPSDGDLPPELKPRPITQHTQMDASKIYYDQGCIIHRSESELKTHTSYLVFAILPRDWTAEEEQQAQAMLSDNIKATPTAPKSHRQLKREAKLRKKLASGTEKPAEKVAATGD